MAKLFQAIGVMFTTVLLVGLFAVLFVEWMAGCGESYVDSKGIRHPNECIIMTWNNK